jgi:hypothetical protein
VRLRAAFVLLFLSLLTLAWPRGVALEQRQVGALVGQQVLRARGARQQ